MNLFFFFYPLGHCKFIFKSLFILVITIKLSIRLLFQFPCQLATQRCEHLQNLKFVMWSLLIQHMNIYLFILCLIHRNGDAYWKCDFFYESHDAKLNSINWSCPYFTWDNSYLIPFKSLLKTALFSKVIKRCDNLFKLLVLSLNKSFS